MVSSLDFISEPLVKNNRVTNVDIAGHKIEICRNAFLLIEMKAFSALTSKTVSVDSSLKVFSIACIAASDPASCPAHTWSDPVEEKTSFLSTYTMTFHVILQRISPTPFGRKPGFLSKGMSRHATNASMETADTFTVQIFLIKLAIVFLRSTFASPKLFEHRILHPSVSIAKVLDPFDGSFSYHFLVDTCKHDLVDIQWNTNQSNVVASIF